MHYPFVGRREGFISVYTKIKGSLKGYPLIKRDTRGSQLIFSWIPLIKTVGGPSFISWELATFPQKNYLIKLDSTLNINRILTAHEGIKIHLLLFTYEIYRCAEFDLQI